MTIGVLGKHLNREMVNSLFLLVFYAFFYFGNLIVSAAVTIGSWWVALVLALILWSLGRKLSGILTLRRIRRQLLNDQAIQPTGRVRWQYPISRICALGLTILAAGHFLILAGQHLTEEDAVALSEYTAPLPFATLSDLYPGSETAPNTGFLDSQVIVWSDFLSPENYDYSEYSQITWEGRSFDAYLTVQFHRTRWAWVADRLAGEFLSQAGGSLLNQTADRIFGQEPVTETELDLPGADYCAYYYSDLHDPYIILRQGEIVLHIRLSPLGDGVALEPEEIAQAFLAQIR